MDTPTLQRCSQSCRGRIVCPCLQVTETELVEHIVTLGLRSVNEVRCQTGAGDGCTGCHRLLRKYLEMFDRPRLISSMVVASENPA